MVMGELFLFGQTVFSLSPDFDPRHQPDFPLDADQYASLKPDEVWSLFDEMVRAQPEIASNQGILALRLSYLLNDKLNVNAVRIAHNANGIETRAARVPDEVLTMLSYSAPDGKLTEDAVERAVWQAELV